MGLHVGVKVENCTKPVTRELIKKLKFDNLLGLDENLRNGNLKSGKINAEMLETKRQFPHEILLYR